MPLDAGLTGLLALSFAMGLRHGFDADHIALIDGITRYNVANRPALAKQSGQLFTAGHLLVVLALVLVVSFVLGSWRPPAWLEVSGVVVSIAFLLTMGVANIAAALRAGRGAMVRLVGLKSRLVGRITDRWGVMGIGMLFALSFDTVSQSALMAVAGAQFGALVPLGAGLAFGAGMFITAGLTSLWVAGMSERVDAHAARASRLTALVIGAMSLAVAAILAAAMLQSGVSAWIEVHGLWLSLTLTAGLAVVFAGCLWGARRPSQPERNV